MFKTSLVVLLCLVFFSWILPLGVFIKPSQEKLACDGQRAICLCSHTFSKASKGLEHGISYKGNTSSKEKSSGGAHHYLKASSTLQIMIARRGPFNKPYLCYTNPTISSIDHVPKA